MPGGEGFTNGYEKIHGTGEWPCKRSIIRWINQETGFQFRRKREDGLKIVFVLLLNLVARLNGRKFLVELALHVVNDVSAFFIA